MPAFLEDDEDWGEEVPAGITELPFPPVTKEHILNCSFHSWHPKYRTITPKARLVPLSQPFLDYLRADGIILPDDEDAAPPYYSDDDSGVFSSSDNADPHQDPEDEDVDVAENWRNIHNAIKSTIDNLGGKIMPKLNWSAPKDATWMNANSMECRHPNDIYLLLKSSDFVTHDLEHAFDETADSPNTSLTQDSIPYHLVLRKAVPNWNPSVEFRCFVRGRKLLCICQRDLNHFEFLPRMSAHLRSTIQQFFDIRLRDTFPDENFVFDVYLPPPHDRVWLVDMNPWAARTDPLLFSWLEILQMPDPVEEEQPEFVRLSLRGPPGASNGDASAPEEKDEDDDDLFPTSNTDDDDAASDSDIESITSLDDDRFPWLPELRLVSKTDPEAYNFSTPQFSAHKLPKDVVDASQSGEGLREFAQDWQNILAKRRREDEEVGSSDDGATV